MQPERGGEGSLGRSLRLPGARREGELHLVAILLLHRGSDRSGQLGHLESSDPLEAIAHVGRLREELRRVVERLDRAPSAVIEMRAARSAAIGRWLENPHQAGSVEPASCRDDLRLDHLPGKRARNEMDLPLVARDSGSFRTQPFDVQGDPDRGAPALRLLRFGLAREGRRYR